jgi:adenylate kinase
VRMVVLGPPGSGKGTQARLLAARLGVVHLSVGASLRAEVAAGSQLGARIAAAVAVGDLVATADVVAIVEDQLRAATRAGGWVLDGAPRTVAQAGSLDGMLVDMDAPVDRVVALDVPDADIEGRLARRARTEHRIDDTADVIAHRLEVWAREGVSVLTWYEARGLLVRVDGTGEVADVAARVAQALEPAERVH